MYPQDGLVINVIEDCPVDLTRLQGDPVQHWQPELGLDRLLYLHRCTAGGERKRERERETETETEREVSRLSEVDVRSPKVCSH